MRYNNSRPTEECPLTKTRSYKYTLSMYCGDGLKFIISCFTILTISITTTLILQILYADGTPQVLLKLFTVKRIISTLWIFIQTQIFANETKGMQDLNIRDGFTLVLYFRYSLYFACTILCILLAILPYKCDKAGIHGAVATDYTNCSQIGTKILRKGGNAMDAAIAATICMTVVAPHKTGLGGGGYIMIYNHKERTDPVIIDFAKNTIKDSFETDGIRIPAVLRGLEYAHNLKGKLPWSQIVKSSATLAKEGFAVSKELATEISKNVDYEILYGHRSAGDILKLHDLSDTLDAVASQGTNVLYNGTFSQKLLRDKAKLSKLLPQLASYKPDVYVAKRSSFYKHTVYYPPHVSLLESMIEALEGIQISAANASAIGTQINVAKVLTNSVSIPLQLKQHAEEEKYTGVMAMDWEDTYVCIITGLSAPFGLGYISSAGFLLDKTDTNNTLSMLVPIIFHNEKALCGLRGVFGTDDALIIGQLLYSIIVRQLNISEAIEYPRYYFSSDGFFVENDPKHSVDTLIRNQLNLAVPPAHAENADLTLKSVNAIIKRKDLMSSHSDSRGGGLASRF